MEINFSSEKLVNVEAALKGFYSEIEHCIGKYGYVTIFAIHDIYSEITGDHSHRPKFADSCYGYRDINDIHISLGFDMEYDPILNEYTPVYKAKMWFSEPKIL